MRKILLLIALLPFAAHSQIIYSPQHYAGGIQVDKYLAIPQDSTNHTGHLVWLSGVVYAKGLDGYYHAIAASGGGTTIPWDSITSKPTFAAIAFSGAFAALQAVPTTIQGYGITNGVRTDLTYGDPDWITSLSGTKVPGFNLKLDSIRRRPGTDSVFVYYNNGTEALAFIDTTGGGGSASRFGVVGEDDAATQVRSFNINGHDFSIGFDGSGNNGILLDHTTNIASIFYNVIGTGAARMDADATGITTGWYDFGSSSYGDAISQFHNGRLHLSAYKGIVVTDDFSYNPATAAPAASSVLDIRNIGNNKGILIPRLTNAQMLAIASPANGLIVFNTTTGGLWDYNGSAWVAERGGGTPTDTTSLSSRIDLKADKATTLQIGPATQDLSTNRAFLTNLLDLLQVVNKGNAPSIQKGIYASRPSTEADGAIYIVTDSFWRVSVYEAATPGWKWISQGTRVDTLYAALPLYVDHTGVKDSLRAKNDSAAWNAKALQGFAIAPTTPTNTQVLAYNTTNSRYEPVTPSVGGVTAGISGSVQIKSATTGTFGNAKNLTADSATGKLSADSVSAHTFRADTVKVNYVNSWPFPSVMESIGHSMVQGSNATVKYFYFNAVQPFQDSTWRNRFATRLGLPDYNHGYSGTGPMDAAMFGIKYQDPANRALTLVMDGWNAIQNTTPIVPNTYNKIINSNKFLWVNVNLRRWKGAGSADSVTTYGTWTSYTNTATAASPSAILSVPLTETKSGSAKQTTTINDSIVWISPVDTGFVVEVLGWKSSGSTIQIYVDNVLSRTVNTNGQTDSINTDIFVLGKVTMPIVFTGLSMASHRVKIVNTTAGKLVVDFFGNLRDARYSYPFIIVHDPDHGGTKTNIVTNNGKQDSLVATIQAMGYPAITFQTNTCLNPAIGIAADSIHPNNTGHRQMDSGLDIVYRSHVPQGEVGTLSMSNALHERYADAPYSYRKLVTTADINRIYSSVPDVFTQDQYIYMSAHNLNITDSGSGHFVRAPNLSISDSSSNTYFYWNARNRFTDNATGLRVFSSAPASIPDFFLIGFNSSTFGGSTTSSKPGFVFAFDARDVTGTMRFMTHPTGTTTDVVSAGIHQSGGWEFGSGFNNTDDLKAWVRITKGTTTRTSFILDSTVLLTTPTKGAIENTGDSVCWTDRNNARKRLATTDLIPTGSVLSVAGNDVTSQTAYGTITTYAVPADGVYEVSGYLVVNSVSVDQIKLTVNFTDHNNVGRALDMFPAGTTTALTAVTGYYSYVTMTIKAKSGTNIAIASDGTTGGSINFDAGATIKKIR
jgi:hypothetical protein